MTKKHGLILLSVIALGILWGAYSKPTPNEGIAFYVGYYFLPVVIITAILNWLVGGDKGTKFKTSLFFSVYASFVVGSLIPMQIQRSEDVEGVEFIVDEMAELIQDSGQFDADGKPIFIEKTYKRNPDAGGSMAVMQDFAMDVFNRLAKQSNEYLTELDAIGWTALLDPERLQADRSLNESRKMIADARLVVSKYKGLKDDLVNQARKEIEFMDLTAAEKQGFEEGFNRGFENSRRKGEEKWLLEEAVIDECEQIVDLLAIEPRSWVIQESQILFETQEQLDQYNKHLAKINAISAAQEAIDDTLIAAQREKLNDL